MKTHVQIVAILHIAFGALGLIAAIAIFSVFGIVGGVIASQGDHTSGGIVGIIAVVLGGFLALLALPGIVGGWALLTGRSWGRPVVLVLGVLHLLQIPIGTALGIYTLWALLREPDSPDNPPTLGPAV